MIIQTFGYGCDQFPGSRAYEDEFWHRFSTHRAEKDELPKSDVKIEN
jgi:hypothetical protein